MHPLQTMHRREWPTGIILSIWIAVLFIAFVMDSSVSRIVGSYAPPYRPGPIDKDGPLACIIRAPGDFRFTLVIAVMLLLLHRWTWRAAGVLCLSGILGGLAYSVVKLAVGRYRPEFGYPYSFHPFPNGLAGIIKPPMGLSFPSGHTTLAFATAASLSLFLPRFRWVFYPLAAIVGIERVLENTHYLSDVVAAAGLGVICRNLTLALVRIFMPNEKSPKAPQPADQHS